jgi:hypothetical protein
VRRDDRAGLLEGRQLERDRGADHRVLPLVGNREAPDPFVPMIAGAVAELAAGGGKLALERRVGAEHQIERPRQHEGRFAVDISERRIRGQPHRGIAASIADVVAAERPRHMRLAVTGGRAETDGDARQA